LLGESQAEAERAQQRGFQNRVYTDSSGKTSNYTLFVPYDYTGDQPYPLILFLNGFGDRGQGGQQYMRVGAPTVNKRQQDSVEFFSLYPQSHDGTWQPDSEDSQRALEILALVEKQYNVDRKRISLTGLSSGGAGTWAMALRYPDRWAAIVPVAGGGTDLGQADLIKDIPCWCFNNRTDQSSPSSSVRRMIEALRAAGGTPRYTEFCTLGSPEASDHNAWDKAYSLPDLYDWLLQQRRL
jgi:predicted peptidase